MLLCVMELKQTYSSSSFSLSQFSFYNSKSLLAWFKVQTSCRFCLQLQIEALRHKKHGLKLNQGEPNRKSTHLSASFCLSWGLGYIILHQKTSHPVTDLPAVKLGHAASLNGSASCSSAPPLFSCELRPRPYWITGSVTFFWLQVFRICLNLTFIHGPKPLPGS